MIFNCYIIIALCYLLTTIATASKLEELRSFYSSECSKLLRYADSVSSYSLPWMPPIFVDILADDPVLLSRLYVFRSEISSLGVCSGHVELTWFGEENLSQRNSRDVLNRLRSELSDLKNQLAQQRLGKLVVLAVGSVLAVWMLSCWLGGWQQRRMYRNQGNMIEEIRHIVKENERKSRLVEDWMRQTEQVLGLPNINEA